MKTHAPLSILLLAVSPGLAAAEGTETSTTVPVSTATVSSVTSTVAPAPAPGGLPTPTVSVSGYVEAFYQFNANQPSNLVTAFRGFDNRTNSFTIHNAVLDATGKLGPVSARLALQVGLAPASYYGSEPTYPAQGGGGASSPDLWRIIQQAIIGYTIPVGRGLLAEAGIFLSPIGIEVLPIKDNWNFSRSNLFVGLPFYHSGVRFTYPLSDTVNAAVYATNGWNNVLNRNPYPCFAGVLAWTPNERLNATLVYFGGVEPFTDAPEGQPWRNLFDFYATWQVTQSFSLATQVDSGFEPNNFGTSWWGAAAVYARVQPVSWLYVAARGDLFHEESGQGPRGTASRIFFPAENVVSGTGTLDFRPVSNLSLRAEYRGDYGSTPMYFKGAVAKDAAGVEPPNTDSQHTFTLGAVAWF